MQINTNSKLKIISATVFLSLFLTACTQPAEDPKTVADKYWNLLQSGNTTEAEKLVTVNSRRDFSQHSDRISADSKIENSTAQTIVNTTITTSNPDNNSSHKETFETVLILQQGEWKIDVTQSTIPPSPTAREEELQKLAEELSQSMQKNIDSIDESMSQGMQLLNQALREGSKEMGNSLLHLMNELNSSMQKSIDKMKQRRQDTTPQAPQATPKSQPQNTDQQPTPNKDEGMI